ncbi:MAG: class I SAM-dependent methyltransferase [Bacteroidales bacterium]|nr:class I SAM-dependent methyltransferase [Bacteroidales bacterium]
MEKPDYGNWVPAKMLYMIGACLAASLVLLVLSICLSWNWIWTLVGALATIGFLVFFCYMYAFHRQFASGMMGKVHEFVKEHLGWDGEGRMLDVGCGAGALTTRCAKAWKNGEFTGIDYWGLSWDYSQKMCERNARLEGVGGRCHFQKGDANHLDFPDGSFDAVVSNFVYHEVRNNPDKEALIRETLRVLRKGGCFSLQDLFGQKDIYGDFDAVVRRLREDGIVSEIHFIRNSEKEIGIPRWMAIPGMLADIGLIYGKK